MIDRDLIEGYPEPSRSKIREAIMVLATTGVLKEQRARLFARVAEGAENEDKEKLGDKILTFRWQSHALLALEQQGESIAKEIEGE